MDVIEAIGQRKSIRAFRPDPVPRQTIERILEIAQRAPSGTNTQPWHVYVCAGAVKQAITDEVLALVRAGEGETYADYDYYPTAWKAEHRERRRGIGWSLYGLVGIAKGDREAGARQAARNFLFFDAPVGLFVTVDTYLGRGSWLDAGMYLQTVMLAAKAFGLDTCPQAAWIPYQKPVLKHLAIPSDQTLVSGLSLGYADPTRIENTLVSEREPVARVAHYHGFE